MATRRTSTIGLTKVTADHPAIKGLNPSLQEIVLKNVADADKDADGRLDIDEFVAFFGIAPKSSVDHSVDHAEDEEMGLIPPKGSRA